MRGVIETFCESGRGRLWDGHTGSLEEHAQHKAFQRDAAMIVPEHDPWRHWCCGRRTGAIRKRQPLHKNDTEGSDAAARVA